MTTTSAINGYLVEAAKVVHDTYGEYLTACWKGNVTAAHVRAYRQAWHDLLIMARQDMELVRRALEAAGDDDE